MRINVKTTPKKVKSKTKHLLIAGVSGYGKGNFGEWYVPKFSRKGWKVFDLNSESRGEGMYYGIRQNDKRMVYRLNYLSCNRLKPQSYGNEIIMFLGNNLKKLHNLPKNVKVCVFNEEWLSNEDLKKFLAFNDSQSELLEAIFEIHNDQKLTLSYLYNFLKAAANNEVGSERMALKRAGTHYASVNTIKRRARALLRSGLFYHNKKDIGKYFQYLDLRKSLNDISSITSFSTYLIDDIYIRYVCVGILLKKFIEILETRQTDIPILFYIREANDFFYLKNSPQYVIDIQNNIDKILRKGRSFGGSEVTVVMDTQLLGDLPDSIFNAFNRFVCFRLPSSDSKMLVRKADIPEDYLKKLASCDVGMGMLIANGEFEYPLLFYPTLHKKSDPEFDVFAYLIKLYGQIDYTKSEFVIDKKPDIINEFIVPKLEEIKVEV